MRPKGIRRRTPTYRPSEGVSGIAIDYISTPTELKTSITETVEVNNPTTHQTNTISETVGVVIT